jgi:hypothetical protein
MAFLIHIFHYVSLVTFDSFTIHGMDDGHRMGIAMACFRLEKSGPNIRSRIYVPEDELSRTATVFGEEDGLVILVNTLLLNLNIINLIPRHGDVTC